VSDPTPNEEDRRKAAILADGMAESMGRLSPDAVEMLAQGIAVARTGGDVRAFLRRQRRTS
jgi:hypothetical protein